MQPPEGAGLGRAEPRPVIMEDQAITATTRMGIFGKLS